MGTCSLLHARAQQQQLPQSCRRPGAQLLQPGRLQQCGHLHAAGGEEPLQSAASVVQAMQEQQPDTYQALAASRLAESRTAETSGRPADVPRFAQDVAEVTILGTGAAAPSKYRNVTGVRRACLWDGCADSMSGVGVPAVSVRGSAFFDCGEASLNQLALVLGPQGLKEALAKLRFVWISHMHADHHVGLAGCA